MSHDGPTEADIIKRLTACFDWEEASVNAVLLALYGEMPKWIPSPSIERARRTIQKLVNDGIPGASIPQRVAEAERDELVFPGVVTDSAAFLQSVYELAHLRYAITVGKSKGLRVLAGEQAEHGQKFMDGRKPRTESPIKKAVRKILTKRPTMKPAELWSELKRKPPKGVTVSDQWGDGRYLEVEGHGRTGYRRFLNIVSEVRRGLRGG